VPLEIQQRESNAVNREARPDFVGVWIVSEISSGFRQDLISTEWSTLEVEVDMTSRSTRAAPRFPSADRLWAGWIKKVEQGKKRIAYI